MSNIEEKIEVASRKFNEITDVEENGLLYLKENIQEVRSMVAIKSALSFGILKNSLRRNCVVPVTYSYMHKMPLTI
jgi:hypothetical protein